jgi:hypothetical protein
MILRLEGKDPGSVYKSIEESIELCKEAIKLDAFCADAWCKLFLLFILLDGLGTCFLKRYFLLISDTEDLQRALTAYRHSVNNERFIIV